ERDLELSEACFRLEAAAGSSQPMRPATRSARAWPSISREVWFASVTTPVVTSPTKIPTTFDSTRRRRWSCDSLRRAATSRWAAGAADVSNEAVELGGVERAHASALGGGHVAEHLVDDAARLRPVAPVVRVVGRPHHVLDAQHVPVHDGVAVDHERGAPVAAEVEARLVRELHREPRAVSPPAVVELLEDVRNPPAPGLDRDPEEVREAIVDAGADDLREVDDHARRADRREAGQVVAADALRLGLLDLTHDADVEVDRHAEGLRGVPEGVVLGADRGTDARERVEPDPAHPELRAALHLPNGRLDPEGGHAAEADQAVGRHPHELLRDPVVVGADAREMELRIGVREEVAHHACRAEEHLRVDAVGVLLLEPRSRPEVALVRLGEGDARPADVLVLAPGGRVDADRRGGTSGPNCHASPPSPSGTTRGALAWNFCGRYRVQRSGGSSTCESAEIRWYSRAMRASYEQTFAEFKPDEERRRGAPQRRERRRRARRGRTAARRGSSFSGL